MAYDVALLKAWLDLDDYKKEKNISIRFLSDEYTIDLKNKHVLSLSCNTPAKDYISILILHYLKQRLKGLPAISEEWISFRQLEGGQGYYPAFKKQVIDSIMRKYSSSPESLLKTVETLKAKRVQLADFSVVIEVFDGVPVLVAMWRGDDEFEPQVNILFDKSIKDIFCTEDIVILAGFVAYSI